MEDDHLFCDCAECHDPDKDALDDLHEGWLADIAYNNGQ